MQIIEILAALGHEIQFVSFSGKIPENAPELKTVKGAINQEKFDFLMGSFNMSGVQLLERAEKLRVSLPPINGNGVIYLHQSYLFVVSSYSNCSSRVIQHVTMNRQAASSYCEGHKENFVQFCTGFSHHTSRLSLLFTY